MLNQLTAIVSTIFVFWNVAIAAYSSDENKFIHEFPGMGVKFRVVAYTTEAVDLNRLKQEIESRVEYLESVFSDYRSDSEVSRLATSAMHQEPVTISKELFHVCQLSQDYHKLTNGAFDPSIGPLSKIWRFARKRNRLPTESRISKAMKSIGWQYVQLGRTNQIALKRDGMQLDFGGIAKGFAADEIIRLLERHMITSALVDAGGDLRVSGTPAGESAWTISTDGPNDSRQKLALSNLAVATSGSTRQRLAKNGKLFSHIIDPRTGEPVTHSLNVTVIAKDAAAADALASAFSVLGIEQSRKICEARDETFAMFVDLNNGNIVYSQGFKKFIRIE